MISRLQG